MSKQLTGESMTTESIAAKPYCAWLIEAINPKTNTAGWIKNIDRDGTYDVYMTTDANEALQFTSKESAQSIIDDAGFQHALGHIKFYASEHMFNCGISEDIKQ